MEYIKSITLDVDAVNNFSVISVKQNDIYDRKIAITVEKEGAAFAPSGVDNIQFRCQKPDRSYAIVNYTDTGSPIAVSDNVYTVSLSEDCLDTAGKALCDLAFIDEDENVLSTATFIMKIIPMPKGDD